MAENGLPLKLKVSDELKDSQRRLGAPKEKPIVLRKRIPTQRAETEVDVILTTTIESVTTGSQAVLVGNFILNLLISASLNQMWSMINT